MRGNYIFGLFGEALLLSLCQRNLISKKFQAGEKDMGLKLKQNILHESFTTSTTFELSFMVRLKEIVLIF